VTLLVTFFLVKSLLEKHSIDTNELGLLYFQLIPLFALLVFSFFYIYKISINELEKDFEEIKNYLIEISEHKNYSATLKVKNFIECLEIGLMLKNVVKRLNKNYKKPSKKS